MFTNLHKDNKDIKKMVHNLSEKLHLHEKEKLLLLADFVKKIPEDGKRIKIFLLFVKKEIKKGNINSTTIKEINKIQRDFFLKG